MIKNWGMILDRFGDGSKDYNDVPKRIFFKMKQDQILLVDTKPMKKTMKRIDDVEIQPLSIKKKRDV